MELTTPYAGACVFSMAWVAGTNYVDGVENGEEYSLEIEGEYASITQSEEFDIRSIKWEQV